MTGPFWIYLACMWLSVDQTNSKNPEPGAILVRRDRTEGEKMLLGFGAASRCSRSLPAHRGGGVTDHRGGESQRVASGDAHPIASLTTATAAAGCRASASSSRVYAP